MNSNSPADTPPSNPFPEATTAQKTRTGNTAPSPLIWVALALALGAAATGGYAIYAGKQRARTLEEQLRQLAAQNMQAAQESDARLAHSQLFLARGVVADGKTVPLPNQGRLPDGTPLTPAHWVILVAPRQQNHGWAHGVSVPKSSVCTVDQETRKVTVYTERWKYPGESRDQGGQAEYLLIYSHRPLRALETEMSVF